MRPGSSRWPSSPKGPHRVITHWSISAEYGAMATFRQRPSHNPVKSFGPRDSEFERVHIEITDNDCPFVSRCDLDVTNRADESCGECRLIHPFEMQLARQVHGGY